LLASFIVSHYLKLMTHCPVSGTCFRRQFLVPETGVSCPVLETTTHFVSKWYRQKNTKNYSDFENFEDDDVIATLFSYRAVSWKMLSSLHFIFHLYLQTNDQWYCLLRLTNYS